MNKVTQKSPLHPAAWLNVKNSHMLSLSNKRRQNMHVETFALGRAFADWSELTDEYLAGMQALRRGDPGASDSMMRMAKLMSECQRQVTGTTTGTIAVAELKQPVATPRSSNWLKSTAAMLFRTTDNLDLLH
ncbi:hypothetical protein [Variovorax guangxiensis]|nr:hypothetical protein [Variovorax guangxiensis]